MGIIFPCIFKSGLYNRDFHKQVTISKQEKIGISFNWDISTMHSPNPWMILDLPPKM